MGARIRAHDWAATPLGPPEGWPQSLRSALSICLHSTFPTVIYWGRKLRLFYNDAWSPIPAERHPGALGRPAREVWADIWDVVEPQMRRVLDTGEGFSTFDQILPMVRGGRLRETYWNYSFTPIRGEDGAVVGIFNQGNEITDRVHGERRSAFLLDLSDRIRTLCDPRAIIETAQAALGRHLNANRVGYGEVEETARFFTTERNWTDGSVPTREGTHDLAGFGPDVLAALRAGEPLLVPDVATDPRTSAPEAIAAFDAIDTRAVITASLVKDGRMRAALYVHACEPRGWTERDAELVTDVAERTWSAVERVRAQTETSAAQARLGESEVRFRNMADNAPVMMWVTDTHGYCTYLNQRWYEFTGHTPEQAEGFGWLDATHPDDRERCREAFGSAIAKQAPLRIEYRLRRADGTYRWALDAASPRFGDDGEYLGYVGSVIDIDERREVEDALRSSEGRFRAAVDAVQGILWTNDASGRMAGEQPGWARLTGQSFDDYQGLGWARAVHPDDVQPTVDAWREAVAQRRPFLFEHRVKRADGSWGCYAIRAIPAFDIDGEVQEWVGVHTDVTAQREAEQRLRESEARLRAVFDAVPVGLLFAEAPSGRITAGNAQVEQVFGHSVLPSPDIAHYREWLSVHADGRPVTSDEYPLSRALRGKEPRPELEVLYHRGDGRDAWVRLIAAPIRDELGVVTGAVVACLDVDAERRAREALRQLNETLEAQVAERTADRDRMWRLTTDIMLVARMDATITAANPAWTSLLGWRADELVGSTFVDLVHPDDRAATLAEVGKLAQGVTTFRFENRCRARDGSHRWISWIAVPAEGLVHAVGRDVTAEKAAAVELAQAQDALRQSQKLESMGQLTGGVAHDFNNLLTPIIGSLDLLQRRGVGDERMARLVDGALQSAERAKTLVQRLLAFARRQPLQPVPVDLAKLVDGMAELIGSTSGPKVKLIVDITRALPNVNADPNQVEMALLNLAVNARDAMPDGGQLTIAAAAENLTGANQARLTPGHYVRLSVSDTGIGMDEATLKRAVEPFFSTKGVGKGTGLGLSMVHGLAAQLGGALTIRSKPGLGTTVELWLPVAVSPAIGEDAPATAAARVAGAGTALLVDDEPLVRTSTAAMLADLGYALVEAASAEEALRHAENGLRFDLLVTDHLMPGMSGTDLAREVRSRWPGIPVLVVSGFAEDEGIAPDLPRLTKPFREEELAASLAALLTP